MPREGAGLIKSIKWLIHTEMERVIIILGGLKNKL